ncbi:hypothetical protein V5799_020848, partial [Amblyomma americanum]
LNGRDFTLWDLFEVQGELTLKQFLDYFKNKHNVEITMMSYGVSMLYSFIMQPPKVTERLNLPMSQVVSQVSKKPIEPHVRSLIFDLWCNDSNGVELDDVLTVRYLLPK